MKIRIIKIIKIQFLLPLNSLHDISHWKRVEMNGRRLSASTRADTTVVSCFAYLHDSQRQNEDTDPSHAERASVYCVQLYRQGVLKITQSQYSQLLYACKFHSDTKVKTDDITVMTCWDADRLDLVRLGISPDPLFLYAKEGNA